MRTLAISLRFTFAKIYNNFVNGEFVSPKSIKFYEIRNPVTQNLIAKVPQTTQEEFNQIVSIAKESFKTWSKTSILSTFFFHSDSQTKVYV